MGGRKKHPARLADGGYRSESACRPVKTGSETQEGGGAMRAVITSVVEGIIGRCVILHDLLGSTDFASIYAGKEGSIPLWRYRHSGETPFTLTLISQTMRYKKRQLIISSDGGLELTRGRGIPVSVELCVERESVSPSAAPTLQMKRSPHVFSFDFSPAIFFETAFSFDIVQEENPYGMSGCGFIAFPDWKE